MRATFELFNSFIVCMPDLSLQDLTNNLSQFESIFKARKTAVDTIKLLHEAKALNVSTEQMNHLVPGFSDLELSVRKARYMIKTIKGMRLIAKNLPSGPDRDNFEAAINLRAKDYANEMENSASTTSQILQQIKALNGFNLKD